MATRQPENKLLIYLAACVLLTLLLSAASAQSSAVLNRAGLILAHGNGQTLKRCVEFTEPQITGLDLLTRSGLEMNVDAGNSVGVAVCRIDGEGCGFPGQSCFCQCQGSPCVYWSYWHLAGGAWKYSNTGASSSVVHNGDVDGWVWGAGNFSGASSPPPSITFDQICALPTATHTYTVTSLPSTNTPIPPSSTPTRVPATSSPVPNAPIPPSRTPTAANPKANSTPVASPSRSLGPTKRATPSPSELATSTQTPEPAIVAIVVPTQTPVIETPPEDETQQEQSSVSAGGSTTMLGRALGWVGILVLGGVFCAGTLVAFGVVFAVLRRLT